MKQFATPPFLGFVAVTTILTIAFRLCISALFDPHPHALLLIVFAPMAYGVLTFLAGWFFGNLDKNRLPFHDLGFRWHLATFVIYFGVSYLWFAAELNAPYPYERIEQIHRTAFVWGIVLVAHLVFYLVLRSRGSIKGLDKKELFE